MLSFTLFVLEVTKKIPIFRFLFLSFLSSFCLLASLCVDFEHSFKLFFVHCFFLGGFSAFRLDWGFRVNIVKNS